MKVKNNCYSVNTCKTIKKLDKLGKRWIKWSEKKLKQFVDVEWIIKKIQLILCSKEKLVKSELLERIKCKRDIG